jgi:MFS family permease
MTQEMTRRLPRDVYVAAFARAASILGNVLAVTALQLEFHDRGAGALMVAGLLAAGVLPIVLLAPLVGLAVDRFDSQKLIVVSSLWQAVACALLAFVGDQRVLLLLVALNACGTAVTNPLFVALTGAMVPSTRLAAANSFQQGAVTIAMMAGPAVGGLATGLTGGAQVPLLFDTVIFSVVAGVSVLIRTHRRPEPSGQRPKARSGTVMLFADRTLAAVVALAVLLALVVHLIYVAQVFLVRDTFGASELTFGLVQATHMAGLLIGTVLASQLNTVRRIVIGTPLGAALMATAIALIGLFQSLPLTFGLYVVAGICMSLVSVPMATLLLLRVPGHAVGRVMASFTAMHRSSSLIAYGLGGLVVETMRPETVYVISGFASLLIVIVMTPVFRRAWERN